MMIFKVLCLVGFIASSVTARQINADGLALIKEFEGFYPKFYKDPVGIKTIGYGHACHVNDCSKVHEPLSQADATALLLKDLAEYESCIEKVAHVDDDKFAALTSFAFNLGCKALQSSTLAKKVQAHDYKGAAAEFGKWTHGGGKVLPGLVRRREAERKLFCKSGGC